MPNIDYDNCRFSITCHTDDIAVVHCLRALCELHVHGIPKMIGWGGSTQAAWQASGNNITVRFTSAADRAAFAHDAQRLLPAGSWTEVGRSDTDPATRQRG